MSTNHPTIYNHITPESARVKQQHKQRKRNKEKGGPRRSQTRETPHHDAEQRHTARTDKNSLPAHGDLHSCRAATEANG